MSKSSIGIDLGGTRIKLGLLQDDNLLEKRVIDARSEQGLQANLPDLEIAIDQMLVNNDVGDGALSGIGLSFPGLVDHTNKRIISTNKKYDDGPNLKLDDWARAKWNSSFYIENDARMAAVGEWIFGAGRGSNDIVMVTIGTGIGSCAIIDGHLLRGKHFQAGCLGGHFTVQYDGNRCTCGNLGCVEAQASTWNISKMVTSDPCFADSSLSNESKIDFQTLFSAAAKGDELAGRIKVECMRIWSAGVINLIHAYDPEVVILGGGILNSKEEIIPFVQNEVAKHAWCPWGDVEVRASELMDDAAVLGVAYCLANPI
ncbi:MAG: ROK family protein [Candidatus Obscuribacterales bacterium]|jgi:glucokinase|nr:ROK family protein [Candidatus Obscuribacterales bacterium]